MADGTDSEEFVLLSGPRIGLKREFAFALKAHTELFASHGSRTRAGRPQSTISNAVVFENLTNKRVKSYVVSNDESNTTNNIVLREEKEKQKESQTDYARTSIVYQEELNLSSSVNEKESKNDSIGDKFHGAEIHPNSIGDKFHEEPLHGEEIPIVIDDNSEMKKQHEQSLVVEKPMKFYTRSLLKQQQQRKTETVEISVSATTSSSSVLSGDVSKNEATTVEDEEGKTLDVASPLRTPSSCKLEMKMSKKIALTKLPSKVKELLETGLLEGLTVHYVFRNNKREGLKGTIKDIGIMCCCTACKDKKDVLTPLQFERHAGSANKRASDYIYLENGNNLRSVMNACRDAPLDALEETIKNAISSSPVQRAPICQNCKGAVPALPFMRTVILCTTCLELRKSQASPASTDGTNARWLKPVFTPKSSNSGSKCVPAQRKSNQGKLTRKDLRLHKLVFEEDGLPDGTELAYYIRGQKLLEGYKKGFGIFCRCCDNEVSPSQFEAHAGWASRRKPYLNIYTSNGVSLHELSLSLSKGRKHSAHDNDDLCSICADFGDLLLCDTCPRAFHKDCVGLLNVPCGDWYCPYCQLMYQREKSCEYNANAKAAGRVPGVDPIAEISQRCIRIVKTPDTEVGGCVLCRSHVFSKSGFGPRTVLLCDQCEKEFHVGCLKDHKMEVLRELPKGEWFCCSDCSKIHSVLQKLLVNGSQKLPDSLLNTIKKKHVEGDSKKDTDLDVRWTLLSGKTASPESRLLLSKAVAIFHERFDPIVDSGTGRDLIPSMVYGRSIMDQDFGGMYCAVLTENSSVVSAGIVRIFGGEVAELPLVATSSEKQGRGYFQSLFSCIEQLLGSLNVKNLVLPAADEAESIWTNRFGFKKMTHEEVCTYRKDCQMMTFQGTPMLQKTMAEVAMLEI